jgi:ankyrin repeat protein
MSTIFDFAENGLLHMLQAYAGNVNVVDNCHRTPLHHAIENDHIDCVKYLVNERNADIDFACEKGCTPLYYAAAYGHIEHVKFLLEKGAIYDDDDVDIAACNGHLECVRYFVEQKGANVNKHDENGWGVIHSAARSGHLECIEYCVENGANINAVTINSYDTRIQHTPLSLAIESGHVDCVKYLLSSGANPFDKLDLLYIYWFSESKELVMKARKAFKEIQAIQAMMSVKTHPRLGQTSTLKVLPTDLIRRLHTYFV